MRRRRVLIVAALALGLTAICVSALVAADIFPEASSQTLASQDQVSAAELSAAIDAQRQVAAKLTRSASFDQRLQKLSEKARQNGIAPVIVKVRAGFKPEGYITSAADRLAQRSVIKEAQDRLLAGLRYEPSSLKRYDDVPYIAVNMDSYGLEQLKSSAEVMDVVPNMSMKLATGESLPQIKAGRAWRAGYTGADKTVVILDSGVDKSHPALLNKVVAEACYSTGTLPGYQSLCPGNVESSTAEDSGEDCDKPELSGVGGCGHGTHIAGIAAGRSGVAKDANIISIQVMSYVDGGECGLGTCLRSQTDDVMDALQHVYDTLRNSHSIAAVNISLVTDITDRFQDTCDADVGAPLKAKIDQLRSVGIPTIIAAGNDGFTDALGYPACISTSISVGAVGDGSGEAPADTVWQHSNSADYLRLLAPGDSITSAIPGGETVSASGTSQAAAHVSGAWAILKQMEPAMSVDDALDRLYIHGTPIARNGLTFRRIQIDEALGVNVPEDAWLALYYNNRNLEGIPAVSLNEGAGFIDRYFNTGESPVAGVDAENYSVRWIRTPTFTVEGDYRFSVTGDDGVRLYIDGQLKIPDGWKDQSPTTYNVDAHLQAGNHEIRLEYYEAGGAAQVRLNWDIVSPLCSQDPPSARWKGEYYNNAYLGGSAVAVKDDGNSDSLNFNWGSGPPDTGCNMTIFPDYFSVRWTRTVNFAQGKYRFTVGGDNGVRLKIGDQTPIERWTDTVGANTAEIQLAGSHKITLEYFENHDGASVSLSWTLLAPEAPTNLQAFPAAAATQINLSWEHNGLNVNGFKIERLDGGGWSEIATVGNGASYTDSSRVPETTYTYRVRAYNSAGNSGYSNNSSATTRLPTPFPLSTTSLSSSQIKLEWPNNSATESGYRIERLNGGSWGEIAVVGANATAYIDSSLAPNTSYTYRVRAYNSLGVSEYSNLSSATTQLPPCSYGVSPTSATFGHGGGAGSVTVSTAAHCSWSASSEWFIHITSGASGAGNGSVNYSIDFFNEWDGYRIASLTAAGRSVTIEQFGPPCPFIPPDFCPSALSQPNELDLSNTDGGPRGLTARYFGNTTLSGHPKLERTDSVVNFNWASNSSDKAAADGFSARWSGQLAAPSNEAYTFYLYSDGGARLWINDHLVIDRWRPPFERQTRSAPIELKAGEKANIRMEYYHTNGDAEIRLLWSSASTSKQIVPRRYLYPEAAANTSAPIDTNKQIGMSPPSRSDAGPKATHSQPIADVASPLSRAGLALLIACGMLVILLRINRSQARERFATAAACVVLRLRKWTNTAIYSGGESRLMMPTIATVARVASARMISNLCKVALFLALAIVAGAQTSSTDGSTPLGIAPGAPAGSFALSGLDNVNLFNGNLNFHLPLLGVGGRGNARYAMTLKIDSKNWRVHHGADGGGTQDFYFPSPNWWSSIEPGYGAGVLQARSTGYGVHQCVTPPLDKVFQHTLTRLTFTLPDGTEYELRDQLTNGQPLPVTDIIPCPSIGPGHLRGKIFSTADGSSMTFISDTDVRDDPLFTSTYPLSGYLLFPDGARYRIDNGQVAWIRDRNGNKLTFTYDSFSRMIAATDSLNRQVTVTYGNPDVITYKGAGGAPRTIRVWRSNLQSALRPNSGYSIQSSLQLFPELNSASSSTLHNPSVISSVELPDGRQYRFYYNPYAELARVELPTGGATEYDYAAGFVGEPLFNYLTGTWMTGSLSGVTQGDNPQGGIEYEIYRRVVERRVYSDGVTLDTRMTYSRPESWGFPLLLNDGFVVMDQYNSAGALLARSKHYYHGSARSSLFKGPIDYPAWTDGKEAKTELIAADGVSVLRRVENNWQQGCSVNNWSTVIANNPRIADTTITLVDTNQVSKQTFEYDCYNNRTDVYEYDFGSGVPGPLIRRTHTSYLTTNGNQGNVNYATENNIHIRNLPTRKIVYDASENVKSQTEFVYDYYGAYPLVGRPGIVQHDGGFDTGYGARGNMTEMIIRNPGGSPSEIHTYNQYDVAGNLVKTIDGRGHETNFDFSDRFGPADDDARSNSGAPELAGGLSYAFQTKVTKLINAIEHSAYIQYDYYLGKPVNAEDVNGIVSSVAYNDALDRPTQGIQARFKVGGGAPAERRQTTITYDNANRVITTTSDRDAFNDNILTGKSYYDGLGRTWRTATYEGSIWSIKDTQFDALGRVSRVSNPYRGADPGAASAPDGLWVETVYDSLGRVVDVETPDGAHVITQYTGAQVMVVDQAGKRRRNETDALGRLIRVTEDPGNLNYETYYTYDALDNLIMVTQHDQIRTFVYDSLSRLVSATNPESGTVAYVYDPNGNLIEKTDARGVKTTITYDELNRVRSKVYSGLTPEGTAVANATPPVNYFYDAYIGLPSGAPSWSGSPSKGRLIGVTYGTGSDGTYYKYDAAGRIATNHQRQGTSSYATNYTYNLAGSPTYEQRGNYINNVWREYFRNSWTYDNAGRLSGMQASLTPFLSFVTLVGNISYAPFGGVQSETYGNGLIHSIGYNERQQPTEIRLGRPENLESVFTIYYMYGIAQNVNDPDPEIAPIHNNGNIARVRYSVSGTVQFAQTFQYDTLNRIRHAVEHNNGAYNDSARAWYQTFEYDRYGNRGINVVNTSDNADSANGALQLADFSELNNRITRAGFIYDAAGNLIAEPGKSYTYDGENRMITATVSGAPTSQYVYDGNGHRVKKTMGGVGTRFEYGAGGELIAERNDATGTVTKVYCYKGGELLATTTNGTAYEYATADHLGTPRAWTNGSGNLVAGGRHDYMPFGEELFAGVGTRTTNQGYATTTQVDGQRKQFGSKERDVETRLDYFLARYYSNIQGRFTGPDEPFADQFENDPQSWNLYTFVRNNPGVNTDPSGRETCYFNGDQVLACEGAKKGSYRIDSENDLIYVKDKNGNEVSYKLDARFVVRGYQGADTLAHMLPNENQVLGFVGAFGAASIVGGTGAGIGLYALGGGAGITTLGLSGASAGAASSPLVGSINTVIAGYRLTGTGELANGALTLNIKGLGGQALNSIGQPVGFGLRTLGKELLAAARATGAQTLEINGLYVGKPGLAGAVAKVANLMGATFQQVSGNAFRIIVNLK